MPYAKEQVETSYRALKEISETFNRSKSLYGKFVLAGGWAPYFITLGKFDHTGSRDVDLVLSMELMKTYTSIERLLTERLRYDKTGPFEFTRTDNDATFEVHFLCEPEHVPDDLQVYRLQRGLSPFIVRGCSIAFQDNFTQKIDNTEILVSGPVASIALKIHAFDNDSNRTKDPYDIYSILASVNNIDKVLSSWVSKSPFVAESIDLLRLAFESETASGPTGAAEYLIAVPSERAEYAARVYAAVNATLRKIKKPA